MDASSSDESCPTCGGAAVRIAYGLPGPKMMMAAEAGEVVLGGCVIGRNPDPAWQCRTDPAHRWGRDSAADLLGL
jgi:hypothetical protein